jgi:hypothetical protein
LFQRLEELCSRQTGRIFTDKTERDRESSRERAELYRMSQEERSIFWEVIVSVILRKKFI